MATLEPLEVTLTHRRQQSQDSGAFIDWSSEDSGSPTNGTEDFVTVVSVDAKEVPSPFVTVLEIGDRTPTEHQDIAEEVLVYRLPGERLGFGLKFEGGTNTAEKVKRLFIQSSAPDSPASRAECSWGILVEGDEILEVDGTLVKDMTRLDCVQCLKESNVCIKLLVRHPAVIPLKKDVLKDTVPTVIGLEMKKSPPPPPIPPRKVPRKLPGLPDEVEESAYSPVPKARSIQPDHKPLSRVPSNPRESPDPTKKVVRRNSLRNPPPEAEVYLDLLSQEDEIRSNWGSESDDTASTISTIVGMNNSNSFSDLPLDSGSDSLFPRLDQDSDSVSCDGRNPDYLQTLQPPATFQDAPLSYGNEDVFPCLENPDEVFVSSLKNFPEEALDEIDLSATLTEVKSSPPSKKSSLIPRFAKSMGFLSPPKPSPRKELPEKTKSNKKRPPPPPPPRSIPVVEIPDDSKSEKPQKSSIPYLKKKKPKDDEKRAKIEKKAKKEKVIEKEEAILPLFEMTSSPEEEETSKLCWPVPELVPTPADNVLPDLEDLGEFGVEAVTTSDPFFLSWGSSKHLETIGEEQEEAVDEDR